MTLSPDSLRSSRSRRGAHTTCRGSLKGRAVAHPAFPGPLAHLQSWVHPGSPRWPSLPWPPPSRSPHAPPRGRAPPRPRRPQPAARPRRRPCRRAYTEATEEEVGRDARRPSDTARAPSRPRLGCRRCPRRAAAALAPAGADQSCARPRRAAVSARACPSGRPVPNCCAMACPAPGHWVLQTPAGEAWQGLYGKDTKVCWAGMAARLRRRAHQYPSACVVGGSVSCSTAPALSARRSLRNTWAPAAHRPRHPAQPQTERKGSDCGPPRRAQAC